MEPCQGWDDRLTIAEPSRVGSSPPPSISIRQLSTPQHSSAESSASTECTLHVGHASVRNLWFTRYVHVPRQDCWISRRSPGARACFATSHTELLGFSRSWGSLHVIGGEGGQQRLAARNIVQGCCHRLLIRASPEHLQAYVSNPLMHSQEDALVHGSSLTLFDSFPPHFCPGMLSWSARLGRSKPPAGNPRLPCVSQHPPCIYRRSGTGARQLNGACTLAACSPTCMAVRGWATLYCILLDAPLQEAGVKLSAVTLTLMLVNSWLGAGPRTLTEASCSVASHPFRMAIVGHSSPNRSQ